MMFSFGDDGLAEIVSDPAIEPQPRVELPPPRGPNAIAKLFEHYAD